MKKFSQIGTILGVAVLISIATPVFAESAPVYDADAVEQQYDNNYDQGSDLPPPPAPDQEGTFVPSQVPDQAPSQPIIQHQITPPSPDQSSSLPLEQRLRRMEQQINNMQNSDSSVRLNTLQGEVQALRGQLEQLMHDLQQVQNQQKSMYSDLDKRLSQQANQPQVSQESQLSGSLPSDAATSTTSSSAPIASAKSEHNKRAPTSTVDETQASSAAVQGQPNVAEEQLIYQTAYNLIKAKKYNDAVTSLQGMLKKYPSGQFASNAHYWLGELYGLMGKNDKALTEFNAVVKSYPRSPRVSDAQLKVGLIYASEFNWTGAKTAFRKVINRYPGTPSARLASEQLKQIRQAGH